MTGDRRQRQLKILELISTRAIRTQEELAEVLTTEGWDVTQSSVSRDIAALRLVKVNGAYTRPARVLAVPQSPDDQRIADGVLTAEAAGEVLVVVHTAPGEASRVGAALDRSAWPEVLGTIAGDDTIFIASRNGAAQKAVLRKLRAVASL